MTDTSTQAPTQDSSAFNDSLNTVLNTAPELGKSPGLSVGIASAGGDVQGNSQAVARGTNILSDTQAHTSVSTTVGGQGELQSALDWFGNHVVADVGAVGHDVAQGAIDVGSKVLSTMNKLIQIVQHEYRYLHDVEATHGALAAVLEGIGIAGGAAAGLATTGSFYGADLGAEAATGIEGQLFYKDSWDRTNQASYTDPNTHQKVSIGRDIMSELGNVIPGIERGTPVFKITSGLIDGIFDMNVGGTELLGLAGKANSAEGLGGVLGEYFPGKAPQTTEAFDNLLNSFSGGNVRRAFADIASKSAGEIAATPAYLPIAQQHELLQALGKEDSWDGVADIFRDVVRTHEMAYMDKLPTLSITRVPFQAMHEAMQDTSLPGIQRFSKAITRLPTTFDDVAKQFTNKDFDPTALDDGTVGVYRTARFTENRIVAASIASEFANAPDLATKVRIWKNLQLSTLFNMAGYRGYSLEEYLHYNFADDPEAQGKWAAAIDRVISGNMMGKGAVYGLGEDGQDISRVFDSETGMEYAAGITHNQTGRLSYLDLNVARRAAAQLAGSRDLFGRFDDFAFDHLTQPVFKRWVLMSPSYAMHIALAELIPNALRLGVFKIARAAVEERAANIGAKVEDGESSAVSGLVWRLFDSARNILPAGTNETIERRLGYMTDLIADNDGDLVSPALASSHNFGEEILPRDEGSINLLRRGYFDSPKKTGNNFGIFGVGHEQYDSAWQARLREVSNDEASKIAARGIADGTDKDTIYNNVAEYLRSQSDDERGNMLRSLPSTTTFRPPDVRPPNMDQFDEWGRAVTENVRGLVKGADGTVHASLLDHIVNGEMTSDNELRSIAPNAKPVNVSGRELVPNGDPKLQRIANAGFRRVLNPMVNFLSRQPIAAAEYARQRELLQDAVDNGIMDVDEAKVTASSAMVQNVIKNVHNLTDRTQWTETFRNWAPFYFAQEQAYRRMGRLLAEDPAAFRKYQLMITNMHDVGQVFSGKNGEGYLVMPGTGWMTSGMVMASQYVTPFSVDTATPVGMGWNLSSSSVIFPLSAGFRPDIGPLVSIPVSAIAQFFPETLSPVLKADLSADANTILGPTATEAWYNQIVPNTIVQRLLTALMPGFNPRSFNSTMMQTLATLDYEHKIPPAGSNYRVMQAFMDRVREQTRVLYIAKALVGAVTPVSPELTDATYNQFTAQVATDINAKKSVSAGLQEFLSKHPDATPFTVWQSSELTGMSVPSSTAAENWINENYDLITRYPNAGILLMPTTGLSTKYNAAVYNEQIAQSLRAKLDPEQWTQGGNVPSYIDALYIAAGNSIFYKWLAQYEQQIKGLAGTAKYDADQAFWGNGTLGSGTIGKYAQQNPVWGNWFNSDSRETERGQAIIQMTKLLSENPGLHSDIADNTRTLLQGYATYQNQITTLTTDGSSSAMQTAAKDSWDNYLAGVAQTDPGMINVITGLFMSIPSASAPQVNISNNAPGTFSAKNWRG